MKAAGKIAAILFSLVMFLWIIGRATGMLQLYTVPTSSNEPTIKRGNYFFSSNLKKPARLDFICYYAFDSSTLKKEVYVHRLCGMPGDTIVIKDGVLYVNGRNVDGDISLNGEFKTPKENLPLIEQADKMLYDDIYRTNEDSVQLFTTSKFLSTHAIQARRVIHPPDYKDEYIERHYQKNWNCDQFGPAVVPAECYFVLGDNRHNALDSRYRGFILKSEYKGTVLR